MTLLRIRSTFLLPRSTWTRIAAVFLLGGFSTCVLLYAIVVLRHRPRHPAQMVPLQNAEVAPPATVATPAHPPVAAKPAPDTAVIQRKLAADTARLAEAKEQRRVLAATVRQESDAEKARVFSSQHRTRDELVSELVLLLNLEKQDKSGSSEVIAVRHKITRLQLELSDADAKANAVRSPDSDANQARLISLHAQIGREEAGLAADREELNVILTQPVQPVDAISHPVSPPTVPETSAPVTRNLTPTIAYVGFPFWIAIASLLAGLVPALSIWITSFPKDFLISEVSLEQALLGRAVFVGSVPRMKTR